MNRIGVYPGSFDPLTSGHLDIVKRVAPLFDEIYIVVAENPKKQSLFTATERKELIEEALAQSKIKSRYSVHSHQGLIVDFCKKIKAKALIRGLRAVSDFEAELQMASMNRRMEPEIETLHVMTDERYFFVSSTLIREIASFQGPLKDLVPPNVEKALRKKMK